MLPLPRFAYFLSLLLMSFIVPSVYAKTTILVDVIHPVLSKNSSTLKISGTAMAEKISKLSPRVEGLIKEVSVDAGSMVKQGQVLLKLDPTLAEYRLKQINADMFKAEVDRDESLRRVKEAEKLVSRKHIPETELQIRKAELELKKAELLSIEATRATEQEIVRRHVLIAPFSGVISNKLSEQGEWVSPGSHVLDLVSLDHIRLDVRVPQERFTDITQGEPVRVVFDTYPDTPVQGKVDVIVPVNDQRVRAFLVRVSLNNNGLRLLPGASATAEFALQNKNHAYVVIPRDAVLNDADGSQSVFVIEDNKAVRRKITLDRMTNEGVSVSQGLQMSDQVVIRGNEVLTENQPVKINSIRP